MFTDVLKAMCTVSKERTDEHSLSVLYVVTGNGFLESESYEDTFSSTGIF
jgi:hypothetical protein